MNTPDIDPHPATLYIGSALSFWLVCRSLYNTISTNLKESELERTQVYSPKELEEFFKKEDNRSFWSKLFFGQKKDKINAFVEGSVACDQPIESQTFPDVKLAHRVFYREDIYSNSMLGKVPAAERKDIKIDAPMYFYLKDPTTGTACKVHRATPAGIESVLEQISVKEWTNVERNFGFLELALINLGLSFPKLTRGIKVGWSEKELGIKIGSTLMVYGEVAYNAIEGKLKIDSPLFYMLKKQDMIKYIKNKMSKSDTIILFLVLIGFLFVFDAGIKRIPNWIRDWRNKKSIPIKKKRLRATRVTLKDDYRCFVCQEKPRTVVLKPCLDLCLCDECYKEIRLKSCPICKEKVTDSMEIFFP